MELGFIGLGRGHDLLNQYLLHGGSSCLGWTSSAQHAPNRSGRGGRTAVSSSTGYGTTSKWHSIGLR